MLGFALSDYELMSETSLFLSVCVRWNSLGCQNSLLLGADGMHRGGAPVLRVARSVQGARGNGSPRPAGLRPLPPVLPASGGPHLQQGNSRSLRGVHWVRKNALAADVLCAHLGSGEGMGILKGRMMQELVPTSSPAVAAANISFYVCRPELILIFLLF